MPRYLSQNEILNGWAFYDDYSETLLPAEPSGWITANRMDTAEIKLLAEKLQRFLTQNQHAFQQKLLQQHTLPHQEKAALESDLSRIAVLIARLDYMPELTSLEQDQLINRVLHLVKPQEFELAEFRDMISSY